MGVRVCLQTNRVLFVNKPYHASFIRFLYKKLSYFIYISGVVISFRIIMVSVGLTKSEYTIVEEESSVSSTEVENYFRDEESLKTIICETFKLFDFNGNGILQLTEIQSMLKSWGRTLEESITAELETISNGIDEEGNKGMTLDDFYKYILSQIKNTDDQIGLIKAFQSFDQEPPYGSVNLVKLRHYLKNKSLKLTNEEVDHLFLEERYWMLNSDHELNYDHLIAKLLLKPTKCKFLDYKLQKVPQI